MIILSEKRLREVMREEFERFMSVPEKPPSVYSIKSANGGEIIMPNYNKEKFDAGQVKSLKDII